MYQVISKYIQKHKKIYFLIVLFFLIDYFLYIQPVREMRKIITLMQENTLTQAHIFYLLFFLTLLILVNYVFSSLWSVFLFSYSSRFYFQWKEKMFLKILGMRRFFFHKISMGDMLTRFTTDVRSLTDAIGYGLMIFFFALGTLFFVTGQMLLISWKVTLVSLLPILLGSILMNKIMEKLDAFYEEQREKVSFLNTEILERVEGVRVIRAYGKKEQLSKNFEEKIQALAKVKRKRNFLGTLMPRICFFFYGLCMLFLLLYGSFLFKTGEVKVPDLVALQLYSVMLIEPMFMVSDFLVVFRSGKISFEKLQEFLSETDEMEENGSVQLENFESLVFQNYSFAYPKDTKQQASEESKENLQNAHVLKNINFTLKKGQTLGIVGKTASGKTSLILQLLRQYPLGQGKLLLNGKEIETYQRESIEKHIAYVPQEHFLFSKSVYENVKIGKLSASEEEIQKALELASFSEDLERMSAGRDTLVGEKGVAISGGQKQRILLARAFLKNAEILILDDALSAVDMKTEAHIIQSIQKERKGKTNILLAHRFSAVMSADCILVLDGGEIVEQGTHEELLNNKAWYYEQYQRQKIKEDGT